MFKKRPRARVAPLKPKMPMIADIFYFLCLGISIVFRGHPLTHGIFSVIPLFVITRIGFMRLVRGDLGSCLVNISILAEAIAHLFHQVMHDDPTLQALHHLEHFLCYMFLAIGNMIYVLDGKQKRKHYKQRKATLYPSEALALFPVFLGGLYYALEVTKTSDQMTWGELINMFCALPLAVQFIFSFFRYHRTSKKSWAIGIIAACLSVFVEFLGWDHRILKSIVHKSTIYLQTQQILTHSAWFERNRYRLI